MGSAPDGPLRMPWSNASTCWQTPFADVDPGGRHPRVLRQDQPRLVAGPHSPGHSHPPEVAACWVYGTTRSPPTEQGTPQGGPCSPVLANLTLDGLERLLRERYPTNTRRGTRAQVNVIRYADDFIITGRSKALLQEEVKPLVEQFLRERGLELSDEKTRITHIEDGVDFLGQHLRKYRGKLLINPAKKNVQAFLAKVRGIIKAHKQTPAGTLILLLNPIIRGWAGYHRHVVSKRTFRAIDRAIFHTLWQWARRRHPTKPTRWVKDRYFGTVGGRHWVFHGEADGAERQLLAAASIPITRHIKVKGEANPFAPAWERYFQHRLSPT